MTAPHHATAEIRLIDLEKRFGDVRAVDGVSLEIRSGEFFSLLGPSGCGKTTTLRMIGGFEQPTSGRVLLRDRDITHDPPDKRPVNMVFQQYALFPHLDVAGNVGFGLRRRNVERAEAARRVGEALELVRLQGFDRRRTNELSGGQQQRVALARALVNRPTVLLLDEPLGALLSRSKLTIDSHNFGAFLCKSQHRGTSVAQPFAGALTGADNNGGFSFQTHGRSNDASAPDRQSIHGHSLRLLF